MYPNYLPNYLINYLQESARRRAVYIQTWCRVARYHYSVLTIQRAYRKYRAIQHVRSQLHALVTLQVCRSDQYLSEIEIHVRVRQLRLYGHVARLPAEDPAHRISCLSRSEGLEHAEGRPHAHMGMRRDSLRRIQPI